MAADEEMRELSAAEWMERQGTLQELHEGRMASLERCARRLPRPPSLHSRSACTASLALEGGRVARVAAPLAARACRFVGFLVLFHAMGKRVQDWWSAASLGLLGYEMSRTQSIMRIATTASPVSGSDVRHKILEIAQQGKVEHSIRVLQTRARLMRWQKRAGAHKAAPKVKPACDVVPASQGREEAFPVGL